MVWEIETMWWFTGELRFGNISRYSKGSGAVNKVYFGNALGLKISSAHITTYGEHVVDTFYVKDIFGFKIDHEDKINQIREELIKAVEPISEKNIAFVE